jgi:hypothetical protein
MIASLPPKQSFKHHASWVTLHTNHILYAGGFDKALRVVKTVWRLNPNNMACRIEADLLFGRESFALIVVNRIAYAFGGA